MREILFRGKANALWIYGDLYHLNDGRVTIRKDGELYPYEVIPKTVGQYTGLTDKNGKKIFEGDIVHCKSRSDSADMVVIYENGQFRLILLERYNSYQPNMGYYDINCFTKTVIGNIYDNPELLKN